MNKQQLASRIWASANKMRSKIEANEYKDYILGFIFYKFLSDKEVKFARTEAQILEEDLKDYLQEEQEEMREYFRENLGYFISYDHLFSTWISKRKDFDISLVTDALSAFTRLVHPTHKKVFDNIFHTLDSGLNKLGTTNSDRTKAVKDLLYLIKDIPMDGRLDYDVLGFIYEYLISQFAANAGKKAGEFYTPHEVSLLMSEIVAEHLKDRERIEIYDPTSGSGSLLINIGRTISKFIPDSNSIKYYAQELKENTYNLTRMNLVMRGILPSNIVVRNGDTLERDWPYFDDDHPEDSYSLLYVDAVVSNPPYSQVWEPKNRETDPRYADFGVAPKSKADYAFLLHDLYHLKSDGIMTIVLPHGVLFRGDPEDGSEGQIRKNLIENDQLETIIGLPPNIFFGTGIPTLIMVLRKQRKDSNVLLIDASKGFAKEGKNNRLRASDIKRVVDAVKSRRSIPGFCQLVLKEDIRKNDYNLNLPRYIHPVDATETWDIYASMFGGIPNGEIDGFHTYWSALPGLREALFASDSTPYSRVREAEVREIIAGHRSVGVYRDGFAASMKGFDSYLFEMLLAHPGQVALSSAEERIGEELFSRLADVSLVDRYDVYQLFDDCWSGVSADLEIIQTEGMEACRVVDPNMVLKGGKEDEVQEGWVGRILPFELVQRNHLTKELEVLAGLRNQLEEADNDLMNLLEQIGEEEKQAESEKEDGYVTASTDAFVPAVVAKEAKRIRRQKAVAEGSVESVLLKADEAFNRMKQLKKQIVVAEIALTQRTIEMISKELTDTQITELLRQKWIEPIMCGIGEMPEKMLDELIGKVEALAMKYATTMLDTENEIAETERELCAMMDELTGNEYDMKGLEELKKLLRGEE